MTRARRTRARDLRPLRDLAARYGVQSSYTDLSEKRRVASPEALLTVLQGLGAPLRNVDDAPEALRAHQEEQRRRRIEPVVVAVPGKPLRIPVRSSPRIRRAAIDVAIELESGEVRDETHRVADLVPARGNGQHSTLTLTDPLPAGYHTIHVTIDGTQHDLTAIVAPARCRPFVHDGDQKRWGLFLPLHALQTRRTWGIGDYTALRKLLRWTEDLSGDILGTLPMLAAYLDDPCDPSPYSPVSRKFWNEIFIDVENAPEWHDRSPRSAQAPTDVRRRLRELRAAKYVDHKGVMALKRRYLESMARRCFASDAGRAAIDRFVDGRPAVQHYARFRAAVERHGVPWSKWSPARRAGRLRNNDYDPRVYEYHLYVQYLADRQLAETAAEARGSGCGLYMDFPLGVNRAGFDTWSEPDAFLMDLSLGAPPDPFFSKGQEWGLPPLSPHGLREQGYRYFRDCLAHNMRHAGVLRIDHIMGFHRAFCVPRGMDATEGVYVTYPKDEFYAIVALESARFDCSVVGEDLGTVPQAVRDAMEQRDIYRLEVMQFGLEGDALPEPVAESVASLNTHDMPTFAAFYNGADIPDRVDLGLLTDEQAEEETRRREALRKTVCRLLRNRRLLKKGQDDTAQVFDAMTRFLARTPADVVLLNLEDLWLEERPQNIPGTSWERPNWTRKASKSFETFSRSPRIAAQLRRVDRERKKVSVQ